MLICRTSFILAARSGEGSRVKTEAERSMRSRQRCLRGRTGTRRRFAMPSGRKVPPEPVSVRAAKSGFCGLRLGCLAAEPGPHRAGAAMLRCGGWLRGPGRCPRRRRSSPLEHLPRCCGWSFGAFTTTANPLPRQSHRARTLPTFACRRRRVPKAAPRCPRSHSRASGRVTHRRFS